MVVEEESGAMDQTSADLLPPPTTRDTNSSMGLKASAMMEHLSPDQRAVLQEVLNASFGASVEFGAVSNKRDEGISKKSGLSGASSNQPKGDHPKLGVGIPAVQTKGIVGAHAISGIDAAAAAAYNDQDKRQEPQQSCGGDQSLHNRSQAKAPEPIQTTTREMHLSTAARESTVRSPTTRASVVGAIAITTDHERMHDDDDDDDDSDYDLLERGNGDDDDDDHTLYTDLVVAQLAEGQSELLKEKEQENQALRDELLRISKNTVEAEHVQVQVVTDDTSRMEHGHMMPSNNNNNKGRTIGAVIMEQEEDDDDSKTAATTRSRGQRRRRRLGFWAFILLLVVVAVTAVVVCVVLVSSSSKTENQITTTTAAAEPPTAPQQQPAVVVSGENSTTAQLLLLPVLDTIKKNDVIRCRAETVEVNKGEGFTIDLCRALAAAVLGDPTKVVFLKIPFGDQFRAISEGEVDVSTTLNTFNMERDVYHQSGYGYTFSDPYFYSGNTFAGVPEFVDCVDRGETFEGICRQLVICVIADTTTKDLVNEHLPGSSTRVVKNGKDLLQSFVDGNCNVMVESPIAIHEERVRELNFTGDYVFAKSGSWTVEPLAMITRQSDPQWSDFVNWILRSLIAAESLNITQENAYTFPQTNVFGEEHPKMFQRALVAVGNYGQMYERHFQGRVPRQGMNLLQRRGGPATGLLVADPLGDILIDESLHQIDPAPNGTLEAVKRRGYLRCGLSEERAGFAQLDVDSGTWFGLDVDFCKGISASLFAGRADTVVYENFGGDVSNQFRGLADGLVDVLAGGTVSLRTDVKEPTTGRGYAISPSYFFEETGARRAILTREDDSQWSDLVRWVSQAPIYAEGQGITQRNASMMPIIELFSTDLRQMLRDTIGTIGNYEEIYNRAMEQYMPRHGGWNRLNSGNDPQHFPYSFADH